MPGSLRYKISLLLALLACSVIATIAVIFAYTSSARNDAAAINVAGRQRMIAQQIRYYSHTNNIPFNNRKQQLLGLINQFDEALYKLEHGGNVSGSELDKAPLSTLPSLNNLKQRWQLVHNALITIINSPIEDKDTRYALLHIESNIPALARVANDLVTDFEQASLETKRNQTAMLAILFSANLLLLAVSLWLIRQYTWELRRKETITRAQDQLVNQIHDAVITMNLGGFIKQWNAGAENLFGYPDTQIVDRHFSSLFPRQQSSTRAKKMILSLKINGILDEKVECRHSSGRTIICHLSMSLLRDEYGNPKGIIAYSIDLTRQHIAEQLAKTRELEWRDTFNAIPDFVCVIDPDFRIIKANSALKKHFAINLNTPVDRRCHELYGCANHNSDTCPHAITMQLKKPATATIDSSCAGLSLLVTTSPILDDKGKYIASVHIAKDISRQWQAEEKLRHLAHYDHLTGLPNRNVFFDRLRQMLGRSEWSDRLIAVLFIDVDRFKNINDTMGHDTGDQMLTILASRLQNSIRDGDTVARLGGDEFAVILADVANKADIPGVAKTILRNIKEPMYINTREFFVTASIGISLCPENSNEARKLVAQADIAMYHAKDRGKNNFRFYDRNLDLLTPERLALETRLRQALERKEYELHYQPKVCLQTGKVVGMEALLRWQSGQNQTTLPAQIIPILEETGLIVPVGNWVLEAACARNIAWQQQGFPAVRMAVNLSARQFQQPGLVATVAEVLKNTGLDPGWLELEITESILMQDVEATSQTLHQLSRLGVHISIDDFGTGYSSLGYLKQFPVSTLKIDKSFIRDISANEDDRALTRTIIAMARSLHMRVIAEGVETFFQIQFLKEHGCDEVQGYYFSKPVPESEFVSLLHDNVRYPLQDPAENRPGY
ncbi:MAG: EAL domain-containing protein [Gammaproteobacteria bacterium]|nr:EAL domain-containing protein [Gammaproteobacteria bacterium]